MALQLNLASSQFGIPFAAAYYRIVTVSISRTRDPVNTFSLMIDVAGYAAKPANEDISSIDFRRYHTNLTDAEVLSGVGSVAKCYAWLAAHPDMAGAVAV